MAPPVTSSPALRPVIPPAPQQPAREGPSAPGAQARFAPGIEAPQGDTQARAASPAAPGKPAPQPGETRHLFTLQTLSAYAGMIIGEDGASLPQETQTRPGGVASHRANAGDAVSPKLRPGSLFDLKV